MSNGNTSNHGMTEKVSAYEEHKAIMKEIKEYPKGAVCPWCSQEYKVKDKNDIKKVERTFRRKRCPQCKDKEPKEPIQVYYIQGIEVLFVSKGFYKSVKSKSTTFDVQTNRWVCVTPTKISYRIKGKKIKKAYNNLPEGFSIK